MFSQCDEWNTVLGPTGPNLERCPHPAQYSLTVQISGEVYTVYRCQFCRDELMAKADSEGIEMLDETPLPLCDLIIARKR